MPSPIAPLFISLLKNNPEWKKVLETTTAVEGPSTRYGSPFTGWSEVNTRFPGSIVRYKNRPCLAGATSDSISTDLMLMDILEPRLFIVCSGDPDLDAAACKLGYVNTKIQGALYVYRTPDRQWGQGTPIRMVNYIPCENGSPMRGWYNSLREFGKMLVNDYPDFDDVRKGWASGGTAWCRAFAIGNIGEFPVVFGKGTGLGMYDRKRNCVTLRRAVAGLPMIEDLKQWMHVDEPA